VRKDGNFQDAADRRWEEINQHQAKRASFTREKVATGCIKTLVPIYHRITLKHGMFLSGNGLTAPQMRDRFCV
jgi:hypothetical protein